MSGKCRRVITYILVLVGLVIVFIYYYQNFIANYFMGMKIVSEEEYAILRESEIMLREDLPITYWNYEVCYDKYSDIYYVSQTLTKSKWEGEIQVLDSQVYILQDDLLKNKEVAIESAHVFRVLAISEMGLSEYQVVFTGMPTIRIDKIEAPENAEEGENYGKITVFEPGAEAEKAQECYATWHPRGNTALRYAKQGYKVNLHKEDWTSEKLSLLGMRKDNDWILNAMYTDSSKVREKLAMDIWEIISESNLEVNETGSHMEYVELFINEEYRGLYGLSEPLDAKQLELDEDDILYKISSDYYMPASYELERHDYNTYYDIELVYPKEMDTSMWLPLSDFLWFFAEKKVWTEPVKPDKYYHTKLSNVGDRQIFDQLIYHMDARMKNDYYVVRSNGDNYELILVPWDFNLTFGDCWTENSITNAVFLLDRAMTQFDNAKNDLWKYYEANLTDEYFEYLEKRWAELQGLGLTEDELINRARTHMEYLISSGAFDRDAKKWPECENSIDLTEIETYISMKIPCLTEYIESRAWPAN